MDNRGEEDQYYIKNHHEPILSEDIFEKAQDILYRRGKPRGKLEKGGEREKFSRKFTLSCKLECGFCEKNYSRRSWNSKTTYAKVIWQCVSFSKKGKKYYPHSKGIEENIIEGAFVETYNRVCGNQKQFRSVLQSNTVLSKFDRNVFESVIEKVILGEEQEDGSVEPYQ
ncbi:recombinase zinc beta ribbon domain-containing protein [Paenibacillus sp. Marseille-Q9583]